jgi:hypothetical protein
MMIVIIDHAGYVMAKLFLCPSHENSLIFKYLIKVRDKNAEGAICWLIAPSA